MVEQLVDCCIKFLEIVENLKENGRITHEEFHILTKSKIEFLSSQGYPYYKKNP
ncbi:MAG: hypothetical protein K0R54_4766 [Clostridiaceae bacterium]|jgi:hypothetical protein|nr:hypothetical protein [Clostridiaceae bacterium]